MPRPSPVLRIHNEFDLQDLVEASGRDGSLVERDFALMTIAAGLVAAYEDSLCFKGGFVLRHVHGHERFSRDIDATRINPPKHKLDAVAVAATIRGSGMRNLVRLNPGTPETDSGRSLDFDRIDYTGPSGRGIVSVEISYREDVIEAPDLAAVGEPYYEPFVIPVMTINEIVAEKLRALAQRLRPTDLADVAMVLRDNEIDAARVRVLAAKKFELVSNGNQRIRIEGNIATMRAQYDDSVSAVAPDAPSYAEARSSVLGRLSGLLP